MTSITTPVSPDLLGVAINGTDKPYRKVIYDIDIDATLDEIAVKLYIGCQEDEMYSDEETFTVKHPTFERWLEETNRLEYDDTRYVAAHDGEAVEMGEACVVAYVDYIKDPAPLDMIAFLKDKKIIPDYIIDQSLITINSI